MTIAGQTSQTLSRRRSAVQPQHFRGHTRRQCSRLRQRQPKQDIVSLHHHGSHCFQRGGEVQVMLRLFLVVVVVLRRRINQCQYCHQPCQGINPWQPIQKVQYQFHVLVLLHVMVSRALPHLRHLPRLRPLPRLCRLCLLPHLPRLHRLPHLTNKVINAKIHLKK